MNVVTRSAFAALVLLAPYSLSAQAIPKADEIFARHVAAIGGKEAVMKISSIKTVGTLQMPSMGITAAIEAYSAAPNRMSMKMTIPGIGDISNGYDGTTAWEVNPMQGPRIKNEKEKTTAQEEADFYGAMLFPKERFISAETVGAADFGGEKTWQVKTVLKSGRVVMEYFAVETGLRVGSQTTTESQQGTLNVITVESAYKQFGPLKMATRSEMTTGPQKMVITLSDVVLGSVPENAFTLPEQIKALVKP